MNGNKPANNPTKINPNLADKKLTIVPRPLPNQPPIGPTTINANGALIKIIRVGSIIIFKISGVIFLTNLVMYDINQTIKIIGITEYV